MSGVNWTCPHCERHVTITDDRFSANEHRLWIPNADGPRSLASYYFVCPNPECNKFTLTAALHVKNLQAGNQDLGEKLQSWNLVPSAAIKSFPTYIPVAILSDYREACLIRDLSPKASATLSRRCLQGILRDFWSVKPGRLVNEIDQIRDRIDPLTWSAIDSLRKLGNIGAHMEKDIDTIVDVDPQEAELLIGLVETLLREWYIAREERKIRMSALIQAAENKS
ncbi:hypothetical protein GETHLI_22080 [Geothrix limicola]|uniref:DUF4145 domain-containing protein n=1 Tax=Geothrix limicola TaxID=2927978 RepID=A0ABQ5QHA1_9BACT|nr:DUF4145 domain-containing protein [Geothrix limicola]GLH73706.1 hypothetical protein GETHLI_22080 [Geothrix limicola]